MTQERPIIFPPPEHIRNRAYVRSLNDYRRLYDASVRDPQRFWEGIAQRLYWFKAWDRALDWNFEEPKIEWFKGGTLNASYNCLDQHVDDGYGDRVAFIWEPNDPDELGRTFTYRELLDKVERAANVLKSLGVKRGDRIAIYLQMVPELPIAMLACARIGAIHSVIFGGLASDILRDRINDSSCKVLVTQDTGPRGTNREPMKTNADAAVKDCPSITHVLVVKRTGDTIPMQEGRDLWWHEALATAEPHCTPEAMDAEDPLFILYTSGSTGKPKGVVHTTGGYLVYASYTHELVFDYHDGDVFWCTADIGWITGHSYVVYGPLCNRATVVLFEGKPNHPDYGRFWEVIEKHEVNIFYTAPTALRTLRAQGDAWPNSYDLSNLRILGTVGEPIKPPEWYWYHEVIGKGRCPIVDTWWQTETGGILITPLPGAIPTKPGSATLPFFGIEPVILDDKGNVLEGVAKGTLAIKAPWPGMMRTVWGDHERFRKTYFERFLGYYYPADAAARDEDGYYWLLGRVDDAIKVAGHLLFTAEIEGAIGKHTAVAEAAVVGPPDEITGQSIFAFVTLNKGVASSDALKQEIIETVRAHMGAIAKPKVIRFTAHLPKTRSSKIIRRLLLKVANGSTDFGDVSTLEDLGVLAKLATEEDE